MIITAFDSSRRSRSDLCMDSRVSSNWILELAETARPLGAHLVSRIPVPVFRATALSGACTVPLPRRPYFEYKGTKSRQAGAYNT